MERERKNERGEGKEGHAVSLLSSPPLPALLVAPFFTQSLTLVPRSLLRNRTETLKLSDLLLERGKSRD